MTSPASGGGGAGSHAFDHLFKLILVGDSGVGKTNLLSRFTKNVFSPDAKSTVGVEFSTRIIPMQDGKLVKGQIWDTAGQERFRAITNAYYRGALGALLIYDVTKLSSFENIPRWLRELKDNAPRDIVLLLCGNKVDLVEKDANLRQVTWQQAQALAREFEIPCIEASAATGLNVDIAFTTTIKQIYEHAQLSKQAPGAGSSGGAGAGAEPPGGGTQVGGAGGAAGSGNVDLGAPMEKPGKSGGKCCK